MTSVSSFKRATTANGKLKGYHSVEERKQYLMGISENYMNKTMVKQNPVEKGRQWSKIFYATDDYFNENSDILFGNMHSDSLHIQVDQNSTAAARKRKKNNRRSKIFYVNCEHINMGCNTQVSKYKKG